MSEQFRTENEAEVIHDPAVQNKETKQALISRRKVLASLGLTGAAVLTGGLMQNASSAASVTKSVYGDSLEEALASPEGAGMIGFSPSNSYPAGSVGEALSLECCCEPPYSMPLTAIDDSTTTGSAYKSEPRLIETKTGKVMAFYRIGAGHVENTGRIVYKVFDKTNKTWGTATVLDDDASYDTRNHVAGADLVSGRLFCFYCVRDATPNSTSRWTYMKYSDDDGVTWSSRVNMSQYCPYPNQANVPYGKLIRFSNGKLLISIYNFRTIFTLSSTDGGLTWGTATGLVPNTNPNIVTVYTTPVVKHDNITEPTLVRINDQQLVCVGRCIPSGFEADGSVTWSFLGLQWKADTSYKVGMYTWASGRAYLCTAAGTSGSTAPSHTSGTAVDGTVTWQYVAGAANWAASTSYSVNQYVVADNTRLYKCLIAGTSGTTAPTQDVLAGNETQLAYFKSGDGGATWSPAVKADCTPYDYQVMMSPPCAEMVDADTVAFAWFARYPEFTLYYVKMQASAFYANPSWAFSIKEGESRHRISAAASRATNDSSQSIHYGYVDLLKLSFASVMCSWYDNPTLVNYRADSYSTIINL